MVIIKPEENLDEILTVSFIKINQLKELSGGKIVLPGDFQLFSTKEILKNNGNGHFTQTGNSKKASKKSKKKKRKQSSANM